MGLFSRRNKTEDKSSQITDSAPGRSVEPSTTLITDREEVASAPAQNLDTDSGLYSVVEKMREKGKGELTLELKQSGNDMNLALHENGQEIEKTVVTPGNEWFDGIAQLYIDEEKSDRGAFTRALVVVNGDSAYRVQASFMNADKNTSNNLQFVAPASATQSSAEAVQNDAAENNGIELENATVSQEVTAAETAETTEVNAAEDSRFNVANTNEDDAATDFSAQDRLSRVSNRIGTEEDKSSNESFNAIAFGEDSQNEADRDQPVEDSELKKSSFGSDFAETATSDNGSDGATAGETAVVEDEANPFTAENTEEPDSAEEVLSPAEEQAISEELEESGTVAEVETADSLEDHAFEESAAETSSAQQADEIEDLEEERTSEPSTYTSAHDISLVSATIPDHVDDEWEEDLDAERQGVSSQAGAETSIQENALQNPPASAGAASSNDSSKNVPSTSADLPESGSNVDVAPSFTAPEHIVAKPSTTALAEGNLVLTEAEVVNRLADVQEKLFGENGSARDVSTVLVRIRTLGSYYDALTHVRQGGFWDQKRTFDLIPEDDLNVLQLKADSYKEGFGSPLAMSLRFTPGIPVQVQFDYQDEGTFAKYSDQLPAQQYVEELRMFPRTGANIPAHMNRALASWTL